MKMYDLCTPVTYTDRENNEKTRWTKVGVMFENGDKRNIVLDSLPLNGKISVFEQKPRGTATVGDVVSAMPGSVVNEDVVNLADVPF